MTYGSVVQAQVACEKCWPAQRQQKRNDLLIRHAFAPELMADLPCGNAPTPQQLPLAFEDILIEDVHASAGFNPSSCACSRNVSLATRTASEIAASLMLPRHSSTILCHAIPLATCSSTSATRIRVPRNVGCPWQTLGSVTM